MGLKGKQLKILYRDLALEEAIEAVSNKLNQDDIVKRLQQSINLIISKPEKEKFLNEFLRYVFNNDDEIKDSIKAKLSLNSEL